LLSATIIFIFFLLLLSLEKQLSSESAIRHTFFAVTFFSPSSFFAAAFLPFFFEVSFSFSGSEGFAEISSS